MREIEITQNKCAIVDDADFEWLNQWKWFAKKSTRSNPFYAGRNSKYIRGKKRHYISMHGFIMGSKKGMEIDHINQNGLDNRRINLPFVTRQQNMMNKSVYRNSESGIKGVSWYKKYEKWIAQIQFGGKKIYIGYFVDKQKAIDAYEKKAKELFGVFAPH